MIVGSQLKNAQIECFATGDIPALDLVDGRIIYDTTLKQVKTYNAGTSAWEVIQSSSSGKNYITNGKAEGNSVTGWVEYDDYVTASNGGNVPNNGRDVVADTNNWALSPSASTVLEGAHNILVEKEGSGSVHGNGISYNFTIDSADCAKKLVISFDYKISDGTYADDDIGVFIFDEDADQIIRVNGESIKSTTGVGTHYAQFQTHFTSVNYRLIFHVTTATTENFDIRFDNVSVSPQAISHGTIVTDWKDIVAVANAGSSLHPTGLGSGSGSFLVYKTRRVGDSIEIDLRFNVTVIGSGTDVVTFPMPDNLSIATRSYQAGSATTYHVEHLDPSGTGDGYVSTGVITNETSNTFVVVEIGTGGNINGADCMATDTQIYIHVTIPIEGWSSNAKMSEDFSGRDVFMENKTGDHTQVFQIAAAAVIKYADAGGADTTGSYNSSSGVYTVPETGKYIVHAKATFEMLAGQNGGYLYLFLDNSTTTIDAVKHTFGTTFSTDSSHKLLIGGVFSFTKGDTLRIMFNHTVQTGDTTGGGTNEVHLNTDPNTNIFSIAKIPSAQTILENEVVAARIAQRTDQTGIDGDPSADDLILFSTGTAEQIADSIDFDTHNAWSTATNKYTAPITGYYQVNASARFSSFTQGEYVSLYLRTDALYLDNKLAYCTIGKPSSYLAASSAVSEATTGVPSDTSGGSGHTHEHPHTHDTHTHAADPTGFSAHLSSLCYLTKGEDIYVMVDSNESSFSTAGGIYGHTTFSIAKIK